ncbi:unnamed protein product [Arctia plantaginis]|uniref:Beta-galactosidase n=1 Tax=Arctia plantaginis TaxID=874455 RepID=A0A8S1A6X5_ARCPL|nr:unnamed protein product [Arctia plantaginis]
MNNKITNILLIGDLSTYIAIRRTKMASQWRVFVIVSLWTVVNNPSLGTEASQDFIPTKRSHVTEGSHNISIVGDEFVLDGKPLRIVSGCLHYFRLPAAYWRDRLRKLKAAGLNSVATYVEWSFHEPEERQYTFEGDHDIVKYIQTAAEEGLHVILRVGPYICAERDLGGLPYWLLGKYPNIRLRTTDKNYQDEAKIWIDKLFSKVSPLLYGNGGPIILVQVENEYGSYGKDMTYKIQVRDMLHEHVGDKAILFTTDGAPRSMFTAGAIPNTLTTIDFNAGANVKNAFDTLRRFMNHGPMMNSEYYTGWLTHWGERFQTTSADILVRTLETMLDYGANVNFYMFFGGSNFGYTSGANYDGTYLPDLTSYDYDSPLTEAGDPTPKFFMIRDKLKKYNLVDESFSPIEPSPKGDYGPVNVTFKVSLLSEEGRASLGKKYGDVSGPTLPTFEKLRQKGGLMLYETTLMESSGLLEIHKPRDLVLVFVDGVYQGNISRMRKIYSLPITSKSGSVLSLLVENQGRINYGNQLHDFKGILSPVKYNKNIINGTWTVTGYPLEVFNLAQVSQVTAPTYPSIFEGRFSIPSSSTPLDTFIDTTGWGKGFIWVNGRNLGRYWPSVGPQVTLYIPGVWLKTGQEENHIQILELFKPADSLTMTFIDHPILNRTGSINLA